MNYRTIEIHWLPRTASEWRTFSAARKEGAALSCGPSAVADAGNAARLWSDLVERHYRIRCRNLKWPSKQRWERWAKRRYPGLSAQSVQQLIGEFCEAV